MHKIAVKMFFILFLIFSVSSNAAADTVDYAADLTEGPLTLYPRSGSYYYDVQEFSVSLSGTYTMEVISDASLGTRDSYLYLYQNSFTNDATNYLTHNDDGGSVYYYYSIINYSLTAGTNYYLVTSTWASGGYNIYTVRISGSGTVSVSGVVTTDLIVDGSSTHDLAGGNETYGWVRLIDGSIIDSGVTSGLLTANSGYDVRLGTISANLAGGPLTKTTSGLVTLSGTNTYTGGTTIEEGTLVINGSVIGDVQVNSLGTLKGTGSIGGTVTNDGTIAPGTSIGTLYVGSYVSNIGSTYEAEVDAAGNSDLIDATGTATINGGVVDVLASGVAGDYARRTSYTIVSADGGVTGTYDDVTSNITELTPLLIYDDPNLVQLLLTRNDINFAVLANAETRNQQSVANVLTAAAPTAFSGDLADVLDLFVDGLSTDEQRAALDELGGQKIHTAMPLVAFSMIETFQKAVGNRMSRLHQTGNGMAALADSAEGIKLAMAGDISNLGTLPVNRKNSRSIWAQAFAIDGDVQSDNNAAGYDYNQVGAVIGADFHLAKSVRLGFTAGYGTADVDTRLHDNGDIESLIVGAYGTYENGPFYLDGIISYADNSYKTDRSIIIGPLVREAKGDYDGNEWAASAEAGYVGKVGELTVQPFVGTRFIHLHEDGFTEKGAGDLNLRVKSRSASSWKVYTGLQASRPFKTGERSLVVPELSVKLVHELRDNNDTVSAVFTGAPAAGSFRVEGIDIARTSMELEAGVKILTGNSLQIGINVGAEVNSDRTAYIAAVGLKYMW